ncbi:MAG: MarR family transcriptional regulator [Sphingomonas bacterium]|nr:MarR family transcriptional regulator [Sphingomonas bacterium]
MDNPLLDSTGYLLWRAAKSRFAQLARHLEPLGIGVSEASILLLIARNPGISQTECGQMLSIKPPNLNPIIRRFIKRALVDSTKGRGRTLCLRLTEEGERLKQHILVEFEAQEVRIYSAVPEHLRQDFAPLLRAVWRPS